MAMDYGALPPEINSARMYSGPGSAPMLAAAAAWDSVAAELSRAAASYQSVVDGLVGEGWLGPASASMAAAVTPYMTWMSISGLAAGHAAHQASAAAGAYESAFAMTVPPAEVAANRAQLMALIATNFLGVNTAAIAATEALYGEMWAQDAAAMYGYAVSSAAASALTPFGEPPPTTNPGGQAGQAAAVAQAAAPASGAQATLTQAMSELPAALQQLATPAAAVDGPTSLWDFLDSNFVNGFVSAGYTSPAILQQTVTGSMADINAVGVSAQPEASALPPMGAGTGNATWQPLISPSAGLSAANAVTGPAGDLGPPVGGVSAGTSRAAMVGRLSVPQSWTAAAQVANPAGATFAGGGWTNAVGPGASGAEAVPAGAPGMPGMPAATSGGGMGHGPRYGFRVTVMPRPPAAG